MKVVNKEQWLNEHGDYLYNYAMKKVRESEVALDLVQETLLAAWKGNFRQPEGSPERASHHIFLHYDTHQPSG